MKTSMRIQSRSRGVRCRPRLFVPVMAGCLLLLSPLLGMSGGTVTECTEGSLRAAMAGGGTVTFACDGTITLASTITNQLNTVLDGSGRAVILNGGNAVQIFYVATNVAFTLINLTLADGFSENGGALCNAGGSVNATNCIFAGNRAAGLAGTVIGGNGAAAAGGAIYNAGHFLGSQCTFLFNRAEGGQGADGNPVATVIPPPAGVGGPGSGGALYNVGALTLERSLLASNSVAGGNGGMGSAGDYYISSSYQFASSGGLGGGGAGGALYSTGTAALINCTLAWNQGIGGAGGTGGTMNGPYPPILWGTQGGNGGDGTGGICSTNGLLRLTNCSVASNFGTGGVGGRGGACTLIGRGGAGGGGVGGVAVGLPPATLVSSLLASSTGTGGIGGYGALNGDKYRPVFGYGPTGYSSGNVRGVVNDLGHNLSSDGSAGLTNNSSFRNLDPELGPLADNGGPGLTLNLEGCKP